MEVEDFVRSELSVSYPGPCCRMVARWIEHRRGFPPLTVFGRDFETEADVSAWLTEPGGIVRAVSRVMRACGIRRTKSPVYGDIGIAVELTGRPVMAICGRSMWFSRDENGLIGISHKRAWRAWRL